MLPFFEVSEYCDRDRLVGLVVRSECIVTTSTHTLTPVGATYESDLPFSHSLSIVVLLTHSHSLIFRYSVIVQLLRFLGLSSMSFALSLYYIKVGIFVSVATIDLCFV